MIISTRHGYSTRGDSKNLDGGLTRSRVVHTELAISIVSKRPDRSVTQNNSCIIESTRYSRRTRHVQNSDRCRAASTGDIDSELSVCIISKNSDRTIAQKDSCVINPTRHGRRTSNSRNGNRYHTIRRIP